MPLFQDSGQTPERRNEEASTIARRLAGWLDQDRSRIEKLNAWESVFIVDMTTRVKKFGSLRFITPQQLFQLRELWQKVGEL